MTDDKTLLDTIDWEARFEAELAKAEALESKESEEESTEPEEEALASQLSSLFEQEEADDIDEAYEEEEAKEDAEDEVAKECEAEPKVEPISEADEKEETALPDSSTLATSSESPLAGTRPTLSIKKDAKPLPTRKVAMPTDTKIYQPPRQFYDAARHARHLGFGAHSAQKLLRMKLSAFLHTQPKLSLEIVMAVLFVLASEGLYRLNFDEILEALKTYQRGQFKHVLNCCESVALLHMKEVRKSLTGDEKADAEKIVSALTPKALNRMDPGEKFFNWDSVHDGHLVSRESAYLLGLVRYARALSSKSEERLDFVFRDSLGIGFRPANMWAEKRPLIIAQYLTPEVEKLVSDAWVCDSRVGLVLTEEPPRGHLSPVNLGVPIIFDREGHIPLMLGIEPERLPAVVEHVLGGVSVTQATGFVDLQKKMPSSVAPWVKTLAEIGYTRVMREIIVTPEGEAMKRSDRAAWHRTYQLLAQKVPLKIPERELSDEQKKLANAARSPYLAMRAETMSLLTRWVAEGKEWTPKEVAEHAKRAQKRLRSLPAARPTKEIGEATSTLEGAL